MFSRDDTKAVKGIAVLLMLFHHLAAFQNRFPVHFSGFKSLLWKEFVTRGYLTQLANNCSICVSIFFFLGGYGMQYRFSRGTYNITNALVQLYKAYWKVYIIYVPIAIIFSRCSIKTPNIFCTRYTYDDPRDLVTNIISNFFGFSSFFCAEWWFFQSYIFTLPLGYLFCKFTDKHDNIIIDVFLVILSDILIRNVFPSITYIPSFQNLRNNFYYSKIFTNDARCSCFFSGIFFAKYNKIEDIKKWLKDFLFSPAIGFICCFLVLYTRVYIRGGDFDTFYCPTFVICFSTFLDGDIHIKKVFEFLGKHSTNMWLNHAFYCYYYFYCTKAVYSTKNVWLDMLILVALSLVSSILIELFYDKVCIYFKKLIKWIKEKLKSQGISPSELTMQSDNSNNMWIEINEEESINELTRSNELIQLNEPNQQNDIHQSEDINQPKEES